MTIQKVLLQMKDIHIFLLLSDECIKKSSRKELSVSDKIDKVVTNRWACTSNFCSSNVCCLLMYQ